MLEVLVGALLLELLDLGPKIVRNLLGSSERVKRLRQAKLLQEVLKLLVLSLNLCKFVTHDSLKDFLELVLLLADRRRNQVSELVLKRVLSVESFEHRDSLAEVLSVGLRNLVRLGERFHHHRFSILFHLRVLGLALSKHLIEIGLVRAAANIS